MIEHLLKMKREMRARFKDTILNAIAQLPTLIIGAIFFYIATGLNPTGTLYDFRIKLFMVFGKVFLAVYVGEILQNVLFPKLDEKSLITEKIEELPSKLYNIMYGRLILHGIMQIMFIYG